MLDPDTSKQLMTTDSTISEQTLRQTNSDVSFEVLDDSDGNAVAIRQARN